MSLMVTYKVIVTCEKLNITENTVNIVNECLSGWLVKVITSL
jgi:hypothetical protein